MTTNRRGLLLAAIAVTLAIGGVASLALRQLIGPIAAAWLWLPAACWAASLVLLGACHRSLSAMMGLQGRLAAVALVVAFLADPSTNAFDRVSSIAGSGFEAAGD